jgi:hypothetical protein
MLTGPRHPNSYHPAPVALTAWHTRSQLPLKLHDVDVAPLPLGCMIKDAAWALTFRTEDLRTAPLLQIDMYGSPLKTQVHLLHPPVFIEP